MNIELLQTLKKGMTNDNREHIDHLIKTSGAGEHPLMDELADVKLSKIITQACVMLARATLKIYEESPGFDTMHDMTIMNEGLNYIANHPVSTNFTQAIILITLALLEEQKGSEMYPLPSQITP